MPVLNANGCESLGHRHKEPIFAKGESSPAFVLQVSKRTDQGTNDVNDDEIDVNTEYSEFYLGNGRYIDMNHNGYYL